MNITPLEEQSLQQSFGRQHINQIKSSSSYTNFIRGKTPYPKVYLKGTDFDFLISIKNADEFVNQINNYMTKLRNYYSRT